MKPQIEIIPQQKEIINNLAKFLKCSPITATLLANRGLTETRRAKTFFESSVADMAHPFAIKDMDKAADRLATALIENHKILIFGDYDADGLTASAVLYDFLRKMTADVSCYIPHRIMEGYGLRPEHIADPAAAGNIQLIITVDCGAGSHEAAAACRRAGIDLIITDHHQQPPPYPEALALVNPSRPDCDAGLDCLCGAGVAFYLLIALRSRLREKGYWKNRPEPNLKQYCDLVAVGTIADIVPVTGENRILVKAGLEILNNTCRPGLHALMAAAGMGKRPVTAEDIAFKLAPRLNAAGRIDHGQTALDLLTAEDTEEARKIADRLSRLNTRRQYIETEITEEIVQVLNGDPERLDGKKSLVLAHRQWHQGVIGIAAARIARQYSRPVALMAISGDTATGSARSVSGINLYQALYDCRHLLEDFGGHARAAGFKIKTENIARFEKELEYAVGQQCPSELPVHRISVDCELPFHLITERLLEEIQWLQPFGEQNPEPCFVANNVVVVSSFLLKNKYRKMVLAQPSASAEKKISAIFFKLPPDQEPPRFYRQVVFRLQADSRNGKKTPQLVIEAVDKEKEHHAGL